MLTFYADVIENVTTETVEERYRDYIKNGEKLLAVFYEAYRPDSFAAQAFAELWLDYERSDKERRTLLDGFMGRVCGYTLGALIWKARTGRNWDEASLAEIEDPFFVQESA